MTENQKQQYKPVEKLIEDLSLLAGQKFILSCGHHVTFNEYLANDIVIFNDKELRIVCLDCAS